MRDEYLEKATRGGPQAYVKKGQVALISSSLHTPPSILSFPAQYSRAAGSHCFQKALLGSLGPRPPSASCCYKASLSCPKQRHFPAGCNPFGATHFSHVLAQCCKYWLLMSCI